MPIAPKTALSIISGAMRLLGILQPGEVPSADDAADGFDRLNELLDAWHAERLMVPVVLPYATPLIANQSSYTVGPGGNFSLPWPRSIQTATYRQTVGGQAYDYPLVQLDAIAWSRVTNKGQKSSVPSAIYVVKSEPLQTLLYWPIPDGTIALTGIIYVPTPIDSFVDLYTAVAIPPAYLKALRYNLAADLAPDFLAQPRPDVVQVAAETKKWVKNNNLVISDMLLDPAVVLGRGR